jgi:hypothetical protein
MKGARRLFRIQALIGGAAAFFVLASALLVIAGTHVAWPSGAAIARACADWLAAGGPAALVGLVVLAATGAIPPLSVRSIRRQLAADRAYLAEFEPGPERTNGTVRFRELRSERPLAFCAGYLRPTIYLSSGAIERLSGEELAAVLAHEAHHLRRRDPLRRLASRVAADALFFVPALRRMSERQAELGELEADQAAVAAIRDRRPLAAALLKFDDPTPSTATAAGVDPERVDHLLGVPGAGAWRLRRLSILASAAVVPALALLAVLLARGAIEPGLAPAMLLATGCMVGMVVGPAAVAVAAVMLSRRALAVRRS